MSYFDEQLRFREQSDDAAMADALDELAGAVMGGRLRAALDDRALAGSAIDEVLKYYRFKPREEESLPEDCTAETQLDLRLRPFGLLRRPVTLDHGWYRRAVGAMMGTLRADGSAVALIPGRLGGYRFFDARAGRWVRLNRRTEALLDDEALCFYRPLPQRALRVADLLKFMGSLLSAGDVLLLLLFSAGAALLGLISPLITRRLFGDVLASGSPQVLAALAVFAVCFSAAQLCFSACRGLYDTRIGLRQDLAVQAAVMSRILSLPAGFFRDYSAGELSQRAAYVRSLCSTLFGAVGMTGLSAVFSLVYIGQIFTFAPSLVLPSLAVTVLSTLLSLGTTLAQMRITRERMELSARTGGLTYAALTGIRKVKLAGAEKRVFARWARSSARETALSYNPPLFLRLSATLNLALTLGGELLLYATAVRSGVGVADYYAFNASYGMIAGALASLASIALTAADIRPTLDMARPILEAVPEASEEREQVTRLRGAIELSHVSFRYADGLPNVLDDFSLRIMPGEYVAIVGATGCGKSTLLRLLLGFERPQKGSIYYDRRDLTRLDLSSLRRCIGTVMQDGQLFMGDIYSNIVLSAPWLTLDDAWRAAEIADIADDIRQMPMGMQTLITEGQGGISGGQKQRLMIARAVAPQPGVLMFDEATSALDNVTQRKVSDAIDGLHCTRIAIAHRLSTVRHADRILFLEGGRIAEEGTYDELIARGGRFAELVARQRPELDFESEA